MALMTPEYRRPTVCTDGVLILDDIARAAGLSKKKTCIALEGYVHAKASSDGLMISLDSDKFPDPHGLTRMELAHEVARYVGFGRYEVLQRAAARRAAVPQRQPRERDLPTVQHPWKTGERGRSIVNGEGGSVIATLTCRCGAVETIRFRQLADGEAMDNKFKQKGWRLDPAKGPCCINTGREKEMASKPSPLAVQATGKMFRMLSTHFEPEAGVYAKEWSDARIAEESGVALAMVAAVRDETFGPLKEPPEIQQLTSDIESVETLLAEEESRLRSIRDMVEGIKIKHAELRKRFAA